MKIKEIAFAVYAVKNLKRARGFYEKVLGLKPTDVWMGSRGGFIEYGLGSHTFAIGMGAKQFKPGRSGATVALEVDDFEAIVKNLKKKKVKFVMEPHDGKVCHMALFLDPDGNQIMIHKRKKK